MASSLASSLIFTHRLQRASSCCQSDLSVTVNLSLALTADERRKVRHYFEADMHELFDSVFAMAIAHSELPETILPPSGQLSDSGPSSDGLSSGCFSDKSVAHEKNKRVQPQTCGIYLRLSRGTVLVDGDRLVTDDHAAILHIIAKPESVMRVTATTPLGLLQAAYHLGNRHVPVELTTTYLQFSPDPVLKQMVERLGLTVTVAIAPFHPEPGAYHTSHATHGDRHYHPSS